MCCGDKIINPGQEDNENNPSQRVRKQRDKARGFGVFVGRRREGLESKNSWVLI
jgi:hypothetical protein